jgi:hypothetical protein
LCTALTNNVYVDLDGRVLEYIKEETILTDVEAFRCLKWSVEDDIIERINTELGLDYIKVYSLHCCHFYMDKGVHYFMTIKYAPIQCEILPQEVSVDKRFAKRFSKDVLKSCVFAAYLGIPEITVFKSESWTTEREPNHLTMEKVRELVDIPFEDLPGKIKIKIDPSKFKTGTVSRLLHKFRTKFKELVFQTAYEDSEKVIRIIKNDIKESFVSKDIKTYSNYIFPAGKLDQLKTLEYIISPSRCPEITNECPFVIEFTSEEEIALNKDLGLEGFKMKIKDFDWILEYPPEFVIQ